MNSPYQLNLSPFDAHTKLLHFVGENKRVLDVGCASGYLAELLKAQDCTVVGIEPDPQAAAQARHHCEEVLCGDVERMEFLPRFASFFDVILMGDVLEHMRDPGQALRSLRGYLKPDGAFVISTPNVANYAIRFSLLFGRFDYRDQGIMDRSHVRFFTWTTLKKLLKDSGLDIQEEEITPGLFCWRPYHLTVSRLIYKFSALGEWEYKLARTFKTLFAFQFIVKAVP